MLNRIVYFYVLKDPSTDDIKYVGRSVSPKSRYRHHLYSGRKEGRKNRKEAWIRSLLDNNRKPIMEIIETIEIYKTINEIRVKEMELIAYYKTFCDLKNGRDFVENDYLFSEESRKKMSRSQLGNTNRRGKKMSDESKILMGKNRRGKKAPSSFAEKLGHKVLQYSKENKFIREWVSIAEASRELSISYGNLHSSVNGKRKSAGNFIWKFKN